MFDDLPYKVDLRVKRKWKITFPSAFALKMMMTVMIFHTQITQSVTTILISTGTVVFGNNLENVTVNRLKKAIKKEKAYEFDNFATDKLKLWKVDISLKKMKTTLSIQKLILILSGEELTLSALKNGFEEEASYLFHFSGRN
ncbi:hypothetical protein GLOIN_2v1636630 [Rhizophagus irregularis DAOM 181602=DAOM 197198]|nr:hypothetical protein GLOIN_2v1636630 [Rhizophagus irregularis DAOM 181602=DAOM 197198]